MSQKNQSDGGQKGFAVGRGLLAAAETLNFSMNEQHSSRPMGGAVSGMGVGGDMEGQDGNPQMSQRGSGSHISNTMKLFSSLGLSPSDLDALAQIPEENISVETLPHILMQLKSHKAESGERRVASSSRDLPSLSSETAFQGGREDWDNRSVGRMGGPSMGQSSARSQSSADFGYSSMDNISPSRGFNLNYSNNGGAGSRERQYSELSRHDSYGGLSMGPSPAESVFMQRRIGSPSQGKIQDFLGVMPSMFPHVCSLCDFDVHSTMEWNQHTNGFRHAENRRLLLQMYPDWDPSMASSRGGGLLDTPNLSAGLLGPAPMSSGQTVGGMSSSWGGGGVPGLKNQPGQPKLRSRVVVAKYDRMPLSNKSLFAFAEQFGCLREHIVLRNKAFLEMETHQEALAMVNYYQQHPASLYGKPITFYLSKELLVIEKDDHSSDRLGREVKGHGSQVVFFSNLPREDEKKKELLTVAGRFGNVQKHLFLTDQAFIQLETPYDAQMLVKYYTLNPLTIRGRQIRLNICTKYKTLNINRRQGQGGFGGDNRGWRSSGPTPSSSKSFSSRSSYRSKTKEDKRKDEVKVKQEEKADAEEKEEEEEEEEEEVAGVMEAEDGGEEAEEEQEQQEDTDGEAEQEYPVESTAESVKDMVQESDDIPVEKDPDGDNLASNAHEDVGVADEMAKQGVESKEQGGQIETEAPTEENEAKDEAGGESAEQTEGDLPEDMGDQDFLENMEDFVTLDELGEDEDESHRESDTFDPTRKGGMRVVNIVGFRRGYGFVHELLALAKPFGEVVKHLVLDLRSEAYLQFATEDEARAMAKFYNSNVTASVCGRPVRVSHSMSYPTIQCGSSRVVYVGQLPSSKYSDDSVVMLAKPFGKVTKYFLNRIKRECFIEMEQAEEAEKMAEKYKVSPPKLNGKRLTVYVSRKYKQLKYGHRRPTMPENKPPKREKSSSVTPKSPQNTEEPPAKRVKEEQKPAEEKDEEKVEEEKKMEEGQEKVEGEEQKDEEEEESTEASCSEQKSEECLAEKETTEMIPEDSDQNQKSCSNEKYPIDPKCSSWMQEEQMEESPSQNGQTEAPPPPVDTKPNTASLPLPPHDPESPLGVEYVKMGYYCRVCFLFYSNEEAAKKTHCSSRAHYDKLQKYLENEQLKAEKKAAKKALV
ncbi:hypothetical protein LDENG_00070710 [Lucifuga dentata]|nr:hypothetical protein LDENG_00070710 [Lucifuga dentata]